MNDDDEAIYTRCTWAMLDDGTLRIAQNGKTIIEIEMTLQQMLALMHGITTAIVRRGYQ